MKGEQLDMRWEGYLKDDSLRKFGGDRKSVDELTQSLNEMGNKPKMVRTDVDVNNVNVYKLNSQYTQMLVNDNPVWDDEHGDMVMW
jgi:hypothetical protein